MQSRLRPACVVAAIVTLLASGFAEAQWVLVARKVVGRVEQMSQSQGGNGASYDSAAGIWRPAFAEDNSGSLPEYERLDLRLARLFSLPKGLGLPESGVCVAYAEALNVLDRRNVLDYTYNQDYSQRIEQASYFNRRMVVCGVALTW